VETAERIAQEPTLRVDVGCPSDMFEYREVMPALSPMKPMEPTSRVQEQIPKPKWIPSELAVGSKGQQEEYAAGAAYKQRDTKDEERRYQKLANEFIEVCADENTEFTVDAMMKRRSEERASPNLMEPKKKKLKSVVEVSPRGTLTMRQRITHDESHLDLTGGRTSPESRLVGTIGVPSPFVRKNVDKTKSYASELSEHFNAPQTCQIAIFDAASVAGKPEDWLIVEARRRLAEEEMEQQLRTATNNGFPVMTEEERLEEAAAIFIGEDRDDIDIFADEDDHMGYEDTDADSGQRDQSSIDMHTGDNPFVPSTVQTRGHFQPRGSRAHGYKSRYQERSFTRSKRSGSRR
jgi:hypothetical protein